MSKREEGETSERGNAAGPSSSTTTAPTTTRVRARPDPFLVACGCFSFLTALAAILCITVNVFSAIRSFKNGSDVFDGIFRCYAVFIGIFVVVAETEWDFIIKFWKEVYFKNSSLWFLTPNSSARYWSIGLAGVCCRSFMTRAYPDTSEERKELVLLQNLASYMLLACGLVYVISGVLCIGFLKRSHQKKEVSTEQAIKDLQDLERRREELEALLIVDRA